MGLVSARGDTMGVCPEVGCVCLQGKIGETRVFSQSTRSCCLQRRRTSSGVSTPIITSLKGYSLFKESNMKQGNSKTKVSTASSSLFPLVWRQVELNFSLADHEGRVSGQKSGPGFHVNTEASTNQLKAHSAGGQG